LVWTAYIILWFFVVWCCGWFANVESGAAVKVEIVPMWKLPDKW
jgi:hypothetical protein